MSVEISQQYYGVCPWDSKQYASSLNKIHLFHTGTQTYDWLYSFLNHHHNLVLKKSYPLEKKRAALAHEQVDQWFQLLNKVIQENNLADRPAQIFNADESGERIRLIQIIS